MSYGSSPYGTTPYGGLLGGGSSPDVTVDLSSLGAGGRLILNLAFRAPNVNGVNVVLDDIAGTLLILYLNRDLCQWFADAGELWRRVPRT
jgi:hypothetical protein